MNVFAMDSWTYSRCRLMQTWPEFAKADITVLGTARSRLASGSTMRAGVVAELEGDALEPCDLQDVRADRRAAGERDLCRRRMRAPAPRP